MQNNKIKSNKKMSPMKENGKVRESVAVNIGLSEKHAASSSMMLNILLADEFVLYTKTLNYHWNVEGMQFRELHKLFENQYNELQGMIDEVAERVRQLGHYALGSMKSFLSVTHILEQEEDLENPKVLLLNLLNDHEVIIRVLRENIDQITEHKDFGTADFITGMMEKHEKMAWMLRSHLC